MASFRGYVLLEPRGLQGPPARYRGLCRGSPPYPDDPSGPEMALWSAWEDAGCDVPFALFSSDLGHALRQLRAYRALGRDYEVLEASLIESPEDAARFGEAPGPPNFRELGFDVATPTCDSPLMDLVSACAEGDGASPANTDHAYLLLLERYFSPRLNEHLLLSSLADASFFLDVYRSLARLSPSLAQVYYPPDCHVFRIRAVEGA